MNNICTRDLVKITYGNCFGDIPVNDMFQLFGNQRMKLRRFMLRINNRAEELYELTNRAGDLINTERLIIDSYNKIFDLAEPYVADFEIYDDQQTYWENGEKVSSHLRVSTLMALS